MENVMLDILNVYVFLFLFLFFFFLLWKFNWIVLTILLSIEHSSRCKLKVYIITHTKEKSFL